MTSECDQGDPECHCGLYDLRSRVEELESAFKKMATYIFKLEGLIKEKDGNLQNAARRLF